MSSKAIALPPGPVGGYVKGGRPTKKRSTIITRRFSGFLVYENDAQEAWAFTCGATPLSKRVVGEVTGMPDEEIESWATAKVTAAKSTHAGEITVNERKLKRFISEMWWDTAKNRNKP